MTTPKDEGFDNAVDKIYSLEYNDKMFQERRDNLRGGAQNEKSPLFHKKV